MSEIESSVAGGYPPNGYHDQYHQPGQQPTSFFSSNQHLNQSPNQLSLPPLPTESASPSHPASLNSATAPPRKKQRTTSTSASVGSGMNPYHSNGHTIAPAGPVSPGVDSYGEDSAVEDQSNPFFGAKLPPVPPIDGKLKLAKKPGLKAAKSTNSIRSNQSDRAQSVDSEGPSKSGGATKAKLKRSQSADKKKKAGRACASCQKAHLTCDDARPCARCIKKGCPEQCHDGARKKAKYLEEIPDELLERKHPQLPPTTDNESIQQHEETQDELESVQGDLLPPVGGSTFNYDPMPYFDNNTFSNEFGSEAANLEYAILSSMLNGNGFAVDGFGQPLTHSINNSDNSGQGGLMISPLEGGPTLSMSPGAQAGPSGTNGINGAGFGTSNLGPFSSSNTFANLFDRSRPVSPTGQVAFGNHVLSPAGLPNTDLFSAPPGTTNNVQSNGSEFLNTSTDANNNSNSLNDFINQPIASGSGTKNDQPSGQPDPAQPSASTAAPRPAQATHIMTAEEAYRSVTKPYPYAQSYHYLVRHLKERFEKNDILRIIRALATFRPSLIALQMPLTEEDETFVERTFQRTLVELNKLISFSGTPTVVWRRTGEICCVGAEFCLLTGWTREELLGKRYIFELFDPGTVVEYYESFAKHAFESTSSSVTSQAVVLGPTGRPVPCAFCFSVRRDLFSCPFLVIGSFLPVLS